MSERSMLEAAKVALKLCSESLKDAESVIRSQAEELERLRALIGVWEKSYANQERLPPEFEAAIFENLDELYESDTASAALGVTKAAPEQERAGA